MSVQVVYKNKVKSSISDTVVLFVDDKYKINLPNNLINNDEALFLNKILKNKKSSKNKIFIVNINEKKTALIIFYEKKNTINDFEKLGASCFEFLEKNSLNSILINNAGILVKNANILLDHFIHGINLKSYKFQTYKSKKNKKLIKITVSGKQDNKNIKNLSALEQGIFFTRDLVSEPGNILNPDEYAKRLSGLKKYGLKVTIYNKNKLKKLGCGALLGVGQGSTRGTYLVTIEWNGSRSKSKPLSFVGKGVCFDTGGISLKPAKFMEDMTYDMGGSAVVVGLMKNFAIRKAKINAVGVVGLVENMPGGNAQRPGDIVKSFSGKTIEVLNTDAEGRLLLADALSFTEQKYKPSLIVDLATLTGAIIVALGSEYAGLFSNNDKLSTQLHEAGNKVDEKVWRMPLHENYDKLINSNNADMQNINYVGGAGSTTAAQFLQRFVSNKTPWAHLDIAGMAFSKYGGALNPSGATGYGVRLLNKFVEDNYE